MNNKEKYGFSFTSASLRLNDCVKMLEYAKEHDMEQLANITDAGIVLGSGNSRTNKTIFRELMKRLVLLTDEEREILLNGDLIAQKQISLLSVCKAYQFIREFLTEVVREKFLTFDYQIYEGDYQSFLRKKADKHQEIEELSDLTINKVKQVIFKILEQSGIIDNIKSRVIKTQLIDANVVKTIAKDNPNWLKVFLKNDEYISNIII
jgi:hypothetical protein